ncbi:MAG: hypothetical protein V4558_15915 [Gemmatimonadota bacterium]
MLAALCCACGGARPVSVPHPDGGVPDSVAFELAVRRVWESAVTDSASLEVAVPPLGGDSNATDPLLVASTDAATARRFAEARRRVLHRLGVREGVIPSAADCPRMPVEADRKTKCPGTELQSLVVGIPRSGGAYFPFGGYDEREKGRLLGEWAVRVIIVYSTPGGSHLTGADVVIRREKGQWMFQRVIVLFTDF